MLGQLEVPFLRLEERILLTAEPTATISTEEPTVDLGGQFQATVTFDNTDPTGVGYQPFVDLILPTTGEDGDDGVSFVGATFLGVPIVTTEIVFDAAGEATHPLAVDALGDPIVITGTPGDTLVVLELPFGSFAPDQTPADIIVTLETSPLADLAEPLDLTVQGGFALGCDPLDNPGTDPTIYGGTTDTISVEPTVFDFEKTFNGDEEETATGPNYTRFYDLSVDVADGQTVDNVVIEDTLPNNIVPVGATIVTGSGSFSFSNGTGSATNGNDFSANFGTITGGAGVDAVVRIEFYIPEFDADGASVIDPNSGDDVVIINDGRATGDFTPLDPRDGPVSLVDDDTAVDVSTEAASIIVQKDGVIHTDNGAPGASPADIIEYTLEVDISDFFTFDNIVLDDVLSDGLRFDSSFTPVFTVVERGTTTSGSFTSGTDMSVTLNLPGDGTTDINFDLSAALAGVAADGILEGGLANGSFGATTATITYHAIVQNEYSVTFPSGQAAIGQGDRVSNTVQVSGDVLENVTHTPTGQSETDDSYDEFVMQTGSVTKSIYAINGNTGFSGTNIAAGDEVTFRLTYALPLSSVEQLTLNDYLPLPVFDGSEVTVFNDVQSTTPPAAGEAQFHLDDTFRDYSGVVPTLTLNAGSNVLGFDFGSFNIDPDQITTIDVLFTVTVQDEVFSDGLQLTNQVTASEGNTENVVAEDNAIVQFVFNQPEVDITKGVIATDRASAVFTATEGPVTFTAPGSSGPRWAGTIDSDGLDTTPIDADLTGIDSGDTVSFAIVLENTGDATGGAFDVQVQDTLPPGFAVPGTGLNLSVTDGAGNAIAFTGSLFGPGGIELTDPAIDEGALGAYDPTSGDNIIVITYDLIATDVVEPDQTLLNTATLANYAAQEGGTDHTTTDLTDTASASTTDPSVDKTFISTSHAGTTGTNLTIGEEVTYHITLTLPEGTTENVVLTDLVPAANNGTLEILSATVLSIGSNISGSAIGVGGSGVLSDVAYGDGLNDQAVFNLGNLVNTADNINNGSDQIVLEITARVEDDARTNDGDVLTNTGRLSYEDASGVTQTLSDNVNIQVVEPDLNIDKVANPVVADGSDFIDYTITLTHDASSNANAYDVILSDLLSDPDLTLVAGTVSLSGSASGSAVVTTGNAPTDTTVVVDVSNIDLGQNLIVEFRALVDPAAVAGDVLPNTADITYGTLPGVDPDERTYNEDDTANVTIRDPDLTKTVVATSISETGSGEHTAAPDLVIGETATYELVIDVPEGTSTLVLTDNLPSSLGVMSYVSHQVVSIGSNLTVTGPTVTVSDAALGDGLDDRIVFDFGAVSNTPDGINSAADQIVVRVTALLEDLPANVNGDTLTNTATLDFGNGTVSDTADIDVVEPELQIDKTVLPLTADAGDEVTYTVVIDHTGASTANAFDLAVEDLLADPNLQLVSGSITASVTGAGPGATPGVTELPGDGFTVALDQLGQNETLTITYRAVVLDGAVFGEEGDNTATVDWDSNPSDVPTDTSRGGSDSDDATVTYPVPTFVKTYLSSSVAETGSSEHGVEPDLVIGEEVTFELIVTVPEGTSDITVTDTLPTGLTFVSSTIATMDGQVTSSAGLALGSGPTSQVGQNVFYDFGTVVNTGAPNDGDQQIIVHVTAVVDDIASNVDGVDLTNSANMTYTSNGGTVTLTDTEVVEVVEPELQIDKTVLPLTADAGDEVTYTVVIDHTGASTANAFDLAVEDLLADPNLQLVSGSITASVTGAGPGATPGVTELPGDGFTVALDQLGQNETLTITYRAVVLDGAVFGEEGDNTATVDWDSNPSDVPTDTSRGGSDSDDATVTYPVPTFVKTYLSSSVAETGSSEHGVEPDLVIGEEVTFELIVTVPEGTSDITVTDTLPTGLTFVSSTIATMDGQVTSSAGLALGSGPTSQVGQNVFYDFGTVVNTGAPNDGDQQIIVHVTAVVDDIASNVDGVDLTNSANMTYTSNGGTVTLTDTEVVEVVEPELQIDKTVLPLTADAGDEVTYTVVIDHTGASTANAFDLAVEDLLADPNLQLVSGSITASVTGAGPGATPGVTELPGDGFTVALDQLGQNETLTITYRAVVLDGAVFGEEGDNTATVDWDSNPSDVPTDTSRGGSDSDDATVTYPVPTFVKTYLSSSVAETGSSEHGVEPDLVIGEEVTFELIVTVPEGTSDITVTDTLPTGLTFVSSTIATMDGQVTSSAGLALGSGPTSQVGQNVFYDFGTVVNTGAPNDGDQQIIVHVTAVVDDIASNVDGVDLTNSANMTYTSNGGTVTLTDTEVVEVVEPELQIDKTVLPLTADAGDEVTYTVVIDHTGASTANAFDLAVEDLLADPNLQLVSGSITASVTGAGPGATPGVTELPGDGFTVALDQLGQNETLTITYRAVVLDGAVFGEEGDNTATVDWDSNPSDVPTDTSRGGSDSDDATVTYPVPTFVKTYLSSSVAETGSSEHGVEPDLVIGEEVTFELIVTVPEGTSDITVTDTLPTGLTFVSSTIATMDGQVTSSTGLALGSGPTSQVGQNVFYDFGTVVNTGAPNDGDQQIVVHVTAVVDDIASNVDGVDLTNSANMTYTSNGGTVTLTDTEVVEVVEPELQIDKTSSDLAINPGDRVTYTLVIDHTATSTANAFDLVVEDLLSDPDLQVVPGSVMATVTGVGPGAAPAITYLPGDGFRVNLAQLGQNETLTITYDADLSPTADRAQDFVNTATTDFDSNPGSGGRTDQVTDSETVYTPPDLIKTIIGTSDADTGSGEFDATVTDGSLGEVITYQLEIILPEILNENVVLRDIAQDPVTGGALDLISAQVISIGAGLTGSALPVGTVIAAVNTDADPYGDMIEMNFGTINNPVDGAHGADDRIIVEVTAVVPIDAANTAGTVLPNLATLDVRVDGKDVSYEDSVDLEVVVPELVIDKTVNTSTADAGDILTYELEISHAGSSTAVARDVLIEDLLSDPNLELVSASINVSGSAAVPVVTELGTDGFTVDISQIELNETVTITYDVLVLDNAVLGSSLDNTADLEWDGTVGPTGLTDTDTDTESVTIQGPVSFDKSIVATSQSETGTGEYDPTIEDVSIGETVTYHLTATLAEGTDTVTITDQLPHINGTMSIVSATVFSIGGNITGSALAVGASGAISDAQLGDGLMDNVVFNFGTVTNAGDNIADANDQIVVEIVALVEDLPENVRGDQLTNTATLDTNVVDLSDTADVEIVEPALSIDKSVSTTDANAGDTVTYTLVVSHDADSNAPGYDVVIEDLLADPALDLVPGTVNVAGVSGTTTIGGAPGTVRVDIPVLLVGETATVTFDVVIGDGAVIGSDLPNTATLDYDSAGGPGGRTDSDSDDETVTVDPSVIVGGPAIAFDKSIVATSQSETGTGEYDPTIEDVSIGETVTYHLTATLAEGTDTVTITDQLPHINGTMSIVSATVFSIGGNITGSALAVGASGAISDAQLGDGLMDNVVFNFGTVTNAGDNIADANDQIVVEIVALVEDLPENVRGDQLTNTATLDTNVVDLSDTADVEIVEPALSIDKSVSTTDANAGDTVTYTLVVSHDADSNAPGYDVVIEDLLADPALDLVPGTVNVSGVSGTTTIGGAPGTVHVDIPVLLVGETATVTFDVVIGDGAVIGSDLPNTATLDYDSAGGPGGRTDSDSDDETVTVDPSVIVGGPAIAFDKSIVATSQSETGTGEYDPTIEDVSIGETVTYHLTATLAEGTDTVTITDQLPHINGTMSIVSATVFSIGGNITGSALAVGASGAISDAQLGDGLMDNVVFNFGTVTNAGDNIADANDQIVVEIVALVEDLPENVRGDQLTNTATLDTITVDLSDTAAVEIVEPEIVVEKTAADAELFVTETQVFTVVISNTGNGPSYNVAVGDTLPSGMTLQTSSISLSGVPASVVSANATSLNVMIPVLDQGESVTITYNAVIDVNAQGGETIFNNVVAEGTSDPTSGREHTDDASVGTLVLVPSTPRIDTPQYGGWIDDEVFIPYVSLDPIFTGTSEYGANIIVTLRDGSGATLGVTSTLADAGGNWVARFPNFELDNRFDQANEAYLGFNGSRLFSNPHGLFDDGGSSLLSSMSDLRHAHVGTQLLDTFYTVEVEQQVPTYSHEIKDRAFNAKTYFTPVVTNEAFSKGKAVEINEVFENRADFALDVLYEASLDPLGLGGNRFTAEFLAAAGHAQGR